MLTVKQVKNFPLQNKCLASGLRTPIKVKILRDHLLALELIKGFDKSFDLGYRWFQIITMML